MEEISEEHFDVCDPQGNPTGQALPRSEVHRRGLWHRSSHIWILNSRNQILLQRRDLSKETDPGKWDISVAGHLSAGQTEKEAAVRETWEELGLVIGPEELEFVMKVRKEYLDHQRPHLDREWQTLFFCRRDVELSSLVLQKGEVMDALWQSLPDFKARVEAGDPNFVGRPGEYETAFRLLGL